MAISVSLGQTMEAFVKSQVKTGFYNSVSEVIRDALRLFIQNQQKNQYQETPEEIKQIKMLLEEAEKSGESKPWTDQTINEIIAGGKKILSEKYDKEI